MRANEGQEEGQEGRDVLVGDSEDSQTWLCEKCGATVGIGDFPLCRGSQSDHGAWVGAEEPLTPYEDFDLTSEPGSITISSRGDRRRIMREANLEYKRKPKLSGQTLYFDMGKH